MYNMYKIQFIHFILYVFPFRTSLLKSIYFMSFVLAINATVNTTIVIMLWLHDALRVPHLQQLETNTRVFSNRLNSANCCQMKFF